MRWKEISHFYMEYLYEIQHAINVNRQYTCFYIEKSV